MNRTALACALLLAHCTAFAQKHPALAESQPIIIYLHGQIIEDSGPTPTQPRWRFYDYPAVVEALGAKGAIVESEVRDSGADVYEYARKTVSRIETLISEGVSPKRIIVVGFSKGGAITLFVSRLSQRPDIRYVTLAACSSWLDAYPRFQISGQVFSIYEKMIATGKEHGAFYLPNPSWVEPLLDWIHDPVTY